MTLGFREKPKNHRSPLKTCLVTCILENYLRVVKAFRRPVRGKGGKYLIFERVASRCAERGISIARLEKEAKLGNATVRGWKKSMPNVDSLRRVAEVLGCTVDELLAPDEAEN